MMEEKQTIEPTKDATVQAVSPDSPEGPQAVEVAPDPLEETFQPPVDAIIYDDTLDGQYKETWERKAIWDGVDPAEVMALRDGNATKQPGDGEPDDAEFKSFAKEGENTLVQETDAIDQEEAKQNLLMQGNEIKGMVERGFTIEEAETQMGGVKPSIYDPVDILTDVVTGGLASMARAGFKAGGKAGAKLVARSIAEDVVFGAVAGGFMATTEELGPFVQTASGVLGVPLTMALVTGGRKAFASFLKNVSTDNKPLYDKMVKVFEEAGDEQGAKIFRQLLKGETDSAPVGMSVQDVGSGKYLGPAGEKIAAKKAAEEAKTSFDEIMSTIDETAEQLIAPPTNLPAGKLAGNINLSKIETGEDVKSLVDTVAKRFAGRAQAARRGVQTEVDIKSLANDLGMDETTLLKRGMGEAYNAEQLLAARHIVWQSANSLSSMAKKISEGDNGTNMMAAFKARVAKHTALQLQLSGATAEAGRALRQQQIVAKSADARMQEVHDLVAAGGAAGVGEMSDKLARQMAEGLADMDKVAGGKLTMSQANTFIKQASKATTFDMITEAWINGLLSGPVTHATNALSNALVAVWQIPERSLASMVSNIPGIGSGQISPGEVLSQMYGMVKGFEDGMRLAKNGAMDVVMLRKLGESAEIAARKQAIKEGFSGDAIETRITNILNDGPGYKGDSLTKINDGRYESISAKNVGLENTSLAHGMDLLGEFVRGPGKSLAVGDDLFKAINYRAELHAQVHRQASSEGLKGKEFAARVRELMADPPENISMEAMRSAREQTFTNDLGKMGKWMQKGTNTTKGLRLIIPFVRTPLNIINYALKRNLATGLFYREARQAIKQGGAARDLAIAKIGLGSMVMAWAGQQTFAGNLTGGGPSGRAKREAWLEHNQPYSFKNPLTGEWVSYGRLEPIGSMLGIAASAAEIIAMAGDDDVESEDVLYAALGGVAKNITSKTYLRGISEFIEAFSSPEQHMERYIQGFVGSVVPTVFSQVNRAFFDPTLRETRTALDVIKSRIPGLSDNLAPRTNQWGKAITLEGGIGPDILSPLYVKDPQYGSIASQELLRIGYDMPSPKKGQSFNGVSVELNGDQLYRLKQLYGQDVVDNNGLGFEETVEALGTGTHPNLALQTDYSNGTDGKDGGKVLMLRGIRQWYLSAAKLQLLEEFPEINEKVIRVQNDRFNAFSGGGVASPYSPVEF